MTSTVRAVAGHGVTAAVLALSLSACGSSPEDQAAEYCELLEKRNAALEDGDQEKVADILGDVADLLMGVKDAGDQREFTDAAQAKCPDLMEPAGF